MLEPSPFIRLSSLCCTRDMAARCDVWRRRLPERFIEREELLQAARVLLTVADVDSAAAIVDDLGFDDARNLAGFPYPGLTLEYYSNEWLSFERHPLLWLNLVPCRFYVRSAGELAKEGARVLSAFEGVWDSRVRGWIVATVATLLSR